MMKNENEGKHAKEIEGVTINISKEQVEVEFSHPKSKNVTKDELVLEKVSILPVEVIEIATK